LIGALKLLLAPLLIALVTLAGRRWGPAVAGALVGLPLTSGPVVFILALQHGTAFAAQSAVGALWGVIPLASFYLIYARLAHAARWPACFAGGLAAYAVAALPLRGVTLAAPAAAGATVAFLALVLVLLPAARAPSAVPRPPAWDIPLRMVVAAAMVVLLTTLARTLGPRLAGFLSPFPVMGAVLTVFTHRLEGEGAAVRVVRGMVIASFTFTAFFLILAELLVRWGIAAAFATAIAAAALLHGASLAALAQRRQVALAARQER
jgi:hypothetical protein